MLVGVCVCVGQINLAGRADIGKCVEDVGELRRRQLGRLVVAAVDSPGLMSVDLFRGQVFVT